MFERTFFDVRIFNAKSYLCRIPMRTKRRKKEKKKFKKEEKKKKKVSVVLIRNPA